MMIMMHGKTAGKLPHYLVNDEDSSYQQASLSWRVVWSSVRRLNNE